MQSHCAASPVHRGPCGTRAPPSLTHCQPQLDQLPATQLEGQVLHARKWSVRFFFLCVIDTAPVLDRIQPPYRVAQETDNTYLKMNTQNHPITFVRNEESPHPHIKSEHVESRGSIRVWSLGRDSLDSRVGKFQPLWSRSMINISMLAEFSL